MMHRAETRSHLSTLLAATACVIAERRACGLEAAGLLRHWPRSTEVFEPSAKAMAA